MPLFMDFHKIENVTVDDVMKAHMADLSVQEKYGVKYHQFWVNQEAGTVFCLTEGPDAKTCELVHQLAHGNVACAMTEVESGTYKLLMGEKQKVDHGVVKNEDGSIDLGYRSIMVVSVRGKNSSRNSKNIGLLQVPKWASRKVSANIEKFNGREIKWANDDSLIAVFNEATEAVKCSAQIHHDLLNGSHEPNVAFKIGICGDQPVTKDGEFFTKAIKLAQRVSKTVAQNQIVICSLVKKLCHENTLASSRVKCLNAKDEQFISDLMDIIDQNMANKSYSIENICKDIGISRPQLYRKVTTLTSRAPNDFLRDMRMEKALNLLKQKSGNISQVALEVGYNNPSYFSKCFAEKFGCMPSEV